VSLAGWSVQYAAATGTSWQVTPLTGTLAPGRYLLVAEAAGSGGTTPLPAAEVTGSIGLAATAGKVALVRSSTALSGGCPLGGDVMDFVGYGSADCSEGSQAPLLPSATDAEVRAAAGCTDTDDNAADFSAGTATPRNGATPVVSCP